MAAGMRLPCLCQTFKITAVLFRCRSRICRIMDDYPIYLRKLCSRSGILIDRQQLFRNMWMGIGSSLLIWVATNSTGGDKLFGAWNLFSYSFRDIENTADITWLYGKGLCICIGLILLLALPKIVRKRG